MKILLLFILVVISSLTSVAQEKDFNLILKIDEQIVSGNITNLEFKAVLKNGENRHIKAKYYPGNLSLSKESYDLLISNETEIIKLKLKYTEVCNEDTKDYDYEIDFRKGWLEHYYFILSIYNTDKKKYKNIFSSSADKHYLFEFDYPGGGMKQLRKVPLNITCD